MSGWQKIKTVATFEFLSAVKRPGYLIATFGMPLFMAAYGGVVAVPAYFAEKSGRAAGRSTAWSIEPRRAAPRRAISRGGDGSRDSARRCARRSRRPARREALDRAPSLSEHFVFRPFATEDEARARARRAPAEGLLRASRRTT